MDACAASDAQVIVYKNEPVFSLIRGPRGTGLDAGRVFAVVALLGDEYHGAALSYVALHPGAEHADGDVVLRGACRDARVATVALRDIDIQGPPLSTLSRCM